MSYRNTGFRPDDFWILGIGIALIVLAGLFYLAEQGHVRLLAVVSAGIGIILILGGLLTGGVLLAVGGALCTAVIVRLAERFTMFFAGLFLVLGIIVIIIWIKGCFNR